MTTISNAGEAPEPPAHFVAETAGMSDAQFDRWVEEQGGQPVADELWSVLAKSGIFKELPPKKPSARAA